MASGIDNIKRGAAKITFAGVDLGWTKGGLKVKLDEKAMPITVDQFGETILNEIIRGKELIVSVSIAETSLMSLMNYVFAGQAVDGGGLFTDLRNGVAIDRYLNASSLVIELMTGPLAANVEGGNTPNKYYLYRAAPIGPLEFSRGYEEGAEIITIDFHCYPAHGDTGTGTGALNLLTDGTKAWIADQWIGFILVDSAGTEFVISASAATTLTVNGTPANGTYYVRVASKQDWGIGVGALNSYTDADKAWGVNAWRGYYLTDEVGVEFLIASNTATVLTITGTPTSGDYTIGIAAGTGVPKLGYRGKV